MGFFYFTILLTILLFNKIDGEKTKSHIAQVAENVKLTFDGKVAFYEIDVVVQGREEEIKLKTISTSQIEEKMIWGSCNSIIANQSPKIDDSVCDAAIPLIRSKQILSIMVGHNRQHWGKYFTGDVTNYNNHLPPDLSSITSTTPHYFHPSLTSSIYDQVLLEIYDANKPVIQIRFLNVGKPDNFNWFDKERIEEIIVSNMVNENIITSIENSDIEYHKTPYVTELVFTFENADPIKIKVYCISGCINAPEINYRLNRYDDVTLSAEFVVISGLQLNSF
ncbi:hypothetical protein SNEBB_001079 [Seison nebaliae]|nr:hypothetical protein SNEBB_001079 [Seison nebaliae]